MAFMICSLVVVSFTAFSPIKKPPGWAACFFDFFRRVVFLVTCAFYLFLLSILAFAGACFFFGRLLVSGFCGTGTLAGEALGLFCLGSLEAYAWDR